MKPFRYSLSASVVLLCACAVAPSPTAPGAFATADVLAVSDGFDPVFYRAFVQNGYETPDRLEPMRVLRGPLRLYLQTHDDAADVMYGRPIAAGACDLLPSDRERRHARFAHSELR